MLSPPQRTRAAPPTGKCSFHCCKGETEFHLGPPPATSNNSHSFIFKPFHVNAHLQTYLRKQALSQAMWRVWGEHGRTRSLNTPGSAQRECRQPLSSARCTQTLLPFPWSFVPVVLLESSSLSLTLSASSEHLSLQVRRTHKHTHTQMHTHSCFHVCTVILMHKQPFKCE